MEQVELFTEAFDPWQHIAEYEASLPLERMGAANVFVGRMRNFNDGDPVTGMYLEHYPGMTERELHRIGVAAAQQWPLENWLLAHRVGAVSPGEVLVVVVAWSVHRNAARDACGFMLEKLKFEAPFWKRERLVDGGERWVDRNTSG